MSSSTTEKLLSLRERRERAGLSRQRFAALGQCSLSYVQQLETGLSPAKSPTLERLERILEALEAG